MQSKFQVPAFKITLDARGTIEILESDEYRIDRTDAGMWAAKRTVGNRAGGAVPQLGCVRDMETALLLVARDADAQREIDDVRADAVQPGDELVVGDGTLTVEHVERVDMVGQGERIVIDFGRSAVSTVEPGTLLQRRRREADEAPRTGNEDEARALVEVGEEHTARARYGDALVDAVLRTAGFEVPLLEADEQDAAEEPVLARDLRVGDTIERSLAPFTIKSGSLVSGGWDGKQKILRFVSDTGERLELLADHRMTVPVTRAPETREPVEVRSFSGTWRAGWLKTGMTLGGMVKLIADDNTATTGTASPEDVRVALSPAARAVTDQVVGDVLTTALEGGIGYWSIASEIVRMRDLRRRAEGETVEGPDDPTVVSVRLEPEVDPDDFEPKTIGLDDVRRGLELVASGAVRVAKVHRAAAIEVLHDEDPDYDVDDADVIVQAAMFGEVVFGG